MSQGIFYFFTRPELSRPLRSKIVPYFTLYTGVLGSMFFFTYIPQLAVMTFVNGPLAIFTTALLILSESATITGLLARNYILKDAILDTFDGTLISRGCAAVLAEGRELKAGGDAIQRLGRALKTPFRKFSLTEIIRYFMYLPLNFIPGRHRWLLCEHVC